MSFQFYRRLTPFQAISFDLDDTLYKNAPVMVKAEQHVADFLAEQWPETAAFDVKAWRSLREQVAATNAELASDMTALRMATLEHGLKQCGVSNPQQAAEAAMAEFLMARNQVDIAADVHQLLSLLAAKYPLVAVSNGNADIRRIGLSDYFVGTFQPGSGRRGKPYSDLFDAAALHLKLSDPRQLLHIGDHPISDVQGALRFGAQAIWLQPGGRPVQTELTANWLPHATLHDLQALRHLVG